MTQPFQSKIITQNDKENQTVFDYINRWEGFFMAKNHNKEHPNINNYLGKYFVCIL